MSDFSLSSLSLGMLVGAVIAFVALSVVVSGHDKDRVSAGVFTYDGKAFLLLPIRNPAAALPPAG